MAVKSTRKFVYDPIRFPTKAKELGYDPERLTEEQIDEILRLLYPDKRSVMSRPCENK